MIHCVDNIRRVPNSFCVDDDGALANDDNETTQKAAATMNDKSTADDTKLSECKEKRKIDCDASAKPALPAKRHGMIRSYSLTLENKSCGINSND